jgi:hypothetical protein
VYRYNFTKNQNKDEIERQAQTSVFNMAGHLPAHHNPVHINGRLFGQVPAHTPDIYTDDHRSADRILCDPASL